MLQGGVGREFGREGACGQSRIGSDERASPTLAGLRVSRRFLLRARGRGGAREVGGTVKGAAGKADRPIVLALFDIVLALFDNVVGSAFLKGFRNGLATMYVIGIVREEADQRGGGGCRLITHGGK
jgi:hypothetical protein